jgi:DNA-binding PadR family transcriptional regulator
MKAKREAREINELLSDFSRFYIITILYEKPSHGYEILGEFQKRLGRRASPSLVYPFLRQLERKGLVRHRVKKIGEKSKKIFELTDEGRALCVRLFRRFSNLVSVAIEPRLEVCAHCGCKVYEGGYKETINQKEMAFCCVHCANSYKQEKA